MVLGFAIDAFLLRRLTSRVISVESRISDHQHCIDSVKKLDGKIIDLKDSYTKSFIKSYEGQCIFRDELVDISHRVSTVEEEIKSKPPCKRGRPKKIVNGKNDNP